MVLSEHGCLYSLLPSAEHCMTGFAASATIVAVYDVAGQSCSGRHRKKNAAS
jgi:hypothetical protein